MDDVRPAGGELCIAHLSDPHLTSPEGVRWPQLLNKRLLGYLSWRRRRQAEHSGAVLDALLDDLQHTRPGHVVITGDLTHIGLPDEFRQARRWLERLGDAERVTVIPGNHDAYVRTAWDSTWTHWQPYMQSDPEWRASSPGFDMFPTLRVRDGVALIGLSSAVPTAPFIAGGRLGAAQRERFARLLRETGERGLFRLVLLHHPPRAEDENWRRRLSDAPALCSLLCEYGAELVLHGHGHANARSAVQCAHGEIPVIGIPSASYAGHKPARRAQYYLYRVARRDDGSWRVQIGVRGWQPDSGRFVQLHEHHLELPAMPSTSS